ncbi:MAG: hypothetical protein Q4B43_11240 [Bacteroidota bacterium]|nr:hypothetical protein [Bacteroidota bacterium]
MRNRNYLMQREKDLTKEERLRLIDIIAKVPENRLPYIVSLARFFFAEETQGTQKANRDKLLFGFLAKYDVVGCPTGKVYDDYLSYLEENGEKTDLIHSEFTKRVNELLGTISNTKRVDGNRCRVFDWRW